MPGTHTKSASIEIGTYSSERGLQLAWVEGFTIEVAVHDGEVLIKADVAGLQSLAAHLLTSADQGVPVGTHVHLEPGAELEDESVSLILERASF